MKIGKTEKIWIIAVAIACLIFYFPGLPAYGDETGCIVHGLISLVLIWGSVYIGCKRVEKEYPLKKEEKDISMEPKA